MYNRMDEGDGDNATLRLFMSPEQFQETSRAAKASEFLTGRQRQVFDLVKTGADTKTIARRLGLAVGTVKVHLAGVYSRLGVANKGQLLAILSGDRPAHWVQDRRAGDFASGRLGPARLTVRDMEGGPIETY